jgi:hypothetical protein
MPSSPNYKRNYAEEKKTSDARGEKPLRAARNRARRKLMGLGMVHKGDGKDVDHRVEMSQGGAKTALSNLKAIPASKNRSFPRNPNGSRKSDPTK